MKRLIVAVVTAGLAVPVAAMAQQDQPKAEKSQKKKTVKKKAGKKKAEEPKAQ